MNIDYQTGNYNAMLNNYHLFEVFFPCKNKLRCFHSFKSHFDFHLNHSSQTP